MSAHDPTRQHYNITFAILATAGAVFALLQSFVVPALVTIQDELGATPTEGSWIFTAYLLTASVATPVVGRAGDIYGKKRMLVVVMVVLGLGTLISALATSIGVMIAGRVVQGIGGAIFPLAFAIIRDEFPPERVASGIALMSALLGIGGGVGIVLAGPIVENLSYHWLFWFPLIAVGIAAVGAVFLIPESPIRSGGRISWSGSALLAGWLVALLLAVSEGHDWGWTSPRVLGLLALAVAVAVAWVAVESRSAVPLVDMQMMRARAVWTTNLSTFLFGFGLFGSFILVPALVQSPEESGVGFSASVTEAGFFLLPTTFAMLLVSPIAGRITYRVGARRPLIAGAVVAALAFLWLAVAHSEPWEVYVASALIGVGLGFAFSSMANQIVEVVRPEQTGVATGMNTIMRTIGGAIGGAVSASVLVSSVTSAGLPDDHAFTVAFVISMAALALAALAAYLIPRRVS